MKTDIEISQQAKMRHIDEIAKKLNISIDDYELYGKYKAKINYRILDEKVNKKSKLILVTAINPSPAGEGKTTTTIGISDAFSKLGKKVVIALREPSLGPVFGVKGGAAGGGYSQVVPMEDINLHFTGDFHAITSAHNLLSAMIDNHIHHGNQLNIDIRNIKFKRVLDMNDRQLRNIVCGLGSSVNGTPRQDGFDITVASEVMAIFCLSKDLEDLKERLGNILIAYDNNKKPIYAKQLNAQGAMCALLKDALKPNLVQTLEGTPCLIHGGPFANIAHGCNSIIATKMAMQLSDITVTEAGFGADLGAEKFLNIKCREFLLKPDATVIVATVKALKYNGGIHKDNLSQENISALQKGLSNLGKHIENITQTFKLPCVVAINKFPTDTQEELNEIKKFCEKLNVSFSISMVWEKGSEGGIDLAEKVLHAIETQENNFKPIYELNDKIEDKILKIAKNIYGAKNVIFSKTAKENIKQIEGINASNLPICMAKTQYSLSDNPSLLARPENFEINVKEIKLLNGAKFIVVLTSDIMTMPGLPKTPSAEKIDIDKDGNISGLF